MQFYDLFLFWKAKQTTTKRRRLSKNTALIVKIQFFVTLLRNTNRIFLWKKLKEKWNIFVRDGVTCLISKKNEKKINLPGESSDTGVLDGVGLCPGGRKCEGDPLLEPPPVPVKHKDAVELNRHLSILHSLTSMKILMWRTMATLIWSAERHSANTWRLSCFHHLFVFWSPILEPNFHL